MNLEKTALSMSRYFSIVRTLAERKASKKEHIEQRDMKIW